jgi:hypothetical protein
MNSSQSGAPVAANDLVAPPGHADIVRIGMLREPGRRLT